MAALPAVAKVVRVDHHYSQAGASNIQIREFYQYAGTLSTADAVTWLAAIVAGMITFVTAAMNNTLTFNSSELTDLSSTSAPQVLNSSGHVGGTGFAPLAAGTALVIRKHLVRRYRGGHPRTYLPGMSQPFLTTPTQWDPTELGVVVAAYQAYITAATTTPGGTAIGAITHVNVSYYEGFTNHTYPSGRIKAIPTPRVTPLVDLIVNTSGNPHPATQRRRDEQ